MKAKKRLAVLMGSVCWFMILSLSPTTGSAEDKFVSFLLSGPLTGPGAAAVLPAIQATNDYMLELNAQGGVDGVTVKTITVDDRYDVARGISAYQRYRKAPNLMAAAPYSTALTKALLPLATRDHVSLFTPGGGLFQAKPGYAFLLSAAYQNGLGAALDWMAADWKKKGKTGMPTVGYLGWDNAAGKDALNGSMEYAKKLGVNFLPPEFFPPGSLKHDTWLTRLAEQGANYIYIFGVDPSHTNVIRDAAGLGLTEKIQFLNCFWGVMSTVGVKTHPEVLEGTVLTASFLRGDDRLKHPAAELFKKYQKQPVEEMNPFYLMGYANGRIFQRALQITLKEVGYEKINGEVFYKAIQKFTGEDVSQGAVGAIDYSPTSRQASKYVRFYQVKSGKLVSISGWIEAPNCVALGKF